MSDTANLTELPAVARNIHLACKKCECDRYHVVVAHTSATSAKVKCEVCGSTKTFKVAKVAAPKKASSAKAGAKKTGARRSSAPDSATVWAELKTQIGVDKILPYNMRTKYQLANAISHPKFGIGFVTNATVDKIDVAFEDTGRALVHNRP